MKTLIYNIGQLVTNKGVVDKDGIGVLKEDLSVVKDAEIFFENGMIRFAGPKGLFAGIKPDIIVDAKGGVLLPALRRGQRITHHNGYHVPPGRSANWTRWGALCPGLLQSHRWSYDLQLSRSSSY